MKYLYIIIGLMAMITTDQAAASVAEDVEAFKQQLCDKALIEDPYLNIPEIHGLDLDSNGTNEIAALRQPNNWAEYILFYKTDCGYSPILGPDGEQFSILSWASSSICFPIGCLSVASCVDTNRGRELHVTTFRNTLSPEAKHRWDLGELPDNEITGTIVASVYQLDKGVMREISKLQLPLSDSNLDTYFGSPRAADLAIDSCR